MEDTKKLEEDKAFMNKMSRQIGTYGIEAMGKLIKLRVAIAGLRGLGVEVAKNLILAGPKSMTIYDDTKVSIEDLSANFYLSESDVGNKTRAEACLDKLKRLNADTEVTVLGKHINLSPFMGWTVLPGAYDFPLSPIREYNLLSVYQLKVDPVEWKS